MPGDGQHPLGHIANIVAAQKAGKERGAYSVCSANRFVLEAAMAQAKKGEDPLLIEATSNQVNPLGGYTGMTPGTFVEYVRDLANDQGFPFERVVLGGDHAGPNPWRSESAAVAMARSRNLVKELVVAGFSKIHLDASMHCADDASGEQVPLPGRVIAERAADLCETAESAFEETERNTAPPVYVIGTEVPPPGGAASELHDILPTTVEDVQQTIEITRQSFLSRGLEAAWTRVAAVVDQPWEEYGKESVVRYDRDRASGLVAYIESQENLVYEAHSTDYQPRQALKEMVEDHFAILKVGPWLTFAFREAVFALAHIENEWLSSRPGVALSYLPAVLDRVMVSNPEHWESHYLGTESEIAYARKYSWSDRSRYYWTHPDVQGALARLVNNLSATPAPVGLLSQHLPLQHDAVREERIPNTPTAMIHDKIMEVTAQYVCACRP